MKMSPKTSLKLILPLAATIAVSACGNKQMGEGAPGTSEWGQNGQVNNGSANGGDGSLGGFNRPGTPGSLTAEQLAAQQAAQRLADLRAKRTVYFQYDSSDVTPEGREVLKAHADWLSQRPQTSVVLSGHADERGSREYNIALGQRRADSVKQLLVLFGVASGNVRTISFGEEKPASYGQGESAWALNRRVEIQY